MFDSGRIGKRGIIEQWRKIRANVMLDGGGLKETQTEGKRDGLNEELQEDG
jgi:hypothetical protein